MIINIKNYNINYYDEGKGKLVVFLHGWGANLDCFNGVYGLLKEKYRVLALDLPGFGKSDKLKSPFSVDDYTDIVEDFISKFVKSSNEKVILVGHSYGGRIIIKLNNRSNLPFVIDKNILIDAAGIKERLSLETKLKICTFKGLKNIYNLLPISEEKKKNKINELRNKFGSSDYKNSDPILKETLVKAVNEDLTKFLKNMKETLLIWGDKDTATPIWMAKIMEKEIKNSGLVILHGGHFSFIDDYYTFLKVLNSYLNINGE